MACFNESVEFNEAGFFFLFDLIVFRPRTTSTDQATFFMSVFLTIYIEKKSRRTKTFHSKFGSIHIHMYTVPCQVEGSSFHFEAKLAPIEQMNNYLKKQGPHLDEQ